MKYVSHTQTSIIIDWVKVNIHIKCHRVSVADTTYKKWPDRLSCQYVIPLDQGDARLWNLLSLISWEAEGPNAW